MDREKTRQSEIFSNQTFSARENDDSEGQSHGLSELE
jgi:hypothetical protein